MAGIPWTPKQETHLKQYAGQLPVRAISLRLNRSVLSVQGKAFQMGISLSVTGQRKEWSTREEKQLIEFAKTMCKSRLAAELGRPYVSVIAKAAKLRVKLISDNPHRCVPWSDGEIRLIIDAIKNGNSIQTLCITLPNRSVDTVTSMYYKTRKEMTK